MPHTHGTVNEVTRGSKAHQRRLMMTLTLTGTVFVAEDRRRHHHRITGIAGGCRAYAHGHVGADCIDGDGGAYASKAQQLPHLGLGPA